MAENYIIDEGSCKFYSVSCLNEGPCLLKYQCPNENGKKDCTVKGKIPEIRLSLLESQLKEIPIGEQCLGE